MQLGGEKRLPLLVILSEVEGPDECLENHRLLDYPMSNNSALHLSIGLTNDLRGHKFALG